MSYPRKNSKTQSSLNFLQSGPRKFTKLIFFGIGPDPVNSDEFFPQENKVFQRYPAIVFYWRRSVLLPL